MAEHKLGRKPLPRDDRDFRLAEILPTVPTTLTRKFWYRPLVLDQGNTGTCFPPGTPVLMADGSERPIEQVGAGEAVVTHTGRTRMVRSVMARPYEGELAVIKVQGRSTELRSTPEHPFLAAERVRHETGDERGRMFHRGTGWRSADQLRVVGPNRIRDELHEPRWSPEQTERTLDVAEFVSGAMLSVDGMSVRGPRCRATHALPRWVDVTPQLGRLLGLYLAEGSHHEQGGDLVLTFGSHEEALYTETAKLFEAVFGTETYIQQRPNNSTNVRVRGATAGALFHSLGGSGASEKHIHDSVWSWPDEALAGVWEGFRDGDGHVRDTGTALTTVSEQLARDLWRIGIRLGYRPTMNHTTSPSALARGSRMRWDVRTYNAQERWLRSDESFVYAPVRSVERERYVGLVYNLDVEDDHSYVADMTVVHNCEGNAWTHWLADGPITHPDMEVLKDPTQGEEYARQLYLDATGDTTLQEGAYTRQILTVLRSRGLIGAYHNAASVDEIINAVLTLGPACFGSDWFSSMDDVVDKYENSYIFVDEASGVRGGHEYIIDGVNIAPADGLPYVRMKNSWSDQWAHKGTARITIEDLRKLFVGDAFIGTELVP